MIEEVGWTRISKIVLKRDSQNVWVMPYLQRSPARYNHQTEIRCLPGLRERKYDTMGRQEL